MKTSRLQSMALTRQFSSQKPCYIPRGEFIFSQKSFNVKKPSDSIYIDRGYEEISEEVTPLYKCATKHRELEQKSLNMVSVYQLMAIALLGYNAAWNEFFGTLLSGSTYVILEFYRCYNVKTNNVEAASTELAQQTVRSVHRLTQSILSGEG